MATSINFALCEGRHEIPQATDGFCFEAEVCNRLMLNPVRLQDYAHAYIRRHVLCDGTEYDSYLDEDDIRISVMRLEGVTFNLYVTGLSVALVAFMNAFKDNVTLGNLKNCKLVLWHYNRDTGDYYSQEVV